MITKFSYSSLNKVINLVMTRELSFINIIKIKDVYYIDYKTCNENNSDKLFDLIVILENFKNSYINRSLTDFYLYYDIDIDCIVHNVKEIYMSDDNVDINRFEILNDLILLRSKMLSTPLDKLTLSEGKKKVTVTYDKLLETVISDIENNLK